MKLGILNFLDTKDMSEEDVKRFEGIDEAFGNAVSEYLKGAVDMEAFKKSIDEMKESISSFKEENAEKTVDKKSFDDQMNEIEKTLISMKAAFENTGKGGELKVKSMEEQIEDQFKDFIKIEKGAKVIDLKAACIASPGAKKEITLVLDQKAVGTVFSTGVATSFCDVQNITFSVEPKARTVIRDVANVVPITGRSLTYTEIVPNEGDAECDPKGGLKPSMDGNLIEKTINAGKVVLTTTSTEGALSDLPSIVAEIRTEIINRIAITEEKGILEGSGTNGEVKGVLSSMPPFSLTGFEVEKANIYDVIIAAYTQIVSTSEMSYRPNMILMNPSDYGKMWLIKDLNGQYLRPFNAIGELIQGLRVESSTAVEPGRFIMGDFSYLNIRDLMGLTITFEWVDNDFKNNQVIITGEKKLMVYIKSQYKTAFVADRYSAVIDAISKK